MEKLMDLISEIIRSKQDEICKVIVDEILDELIDGVLDTYQKNPDMEYETLRLKIIEKLIEKEDS